jgi:hypothetical protein
MDSAQRSIAGIPASGFLKLCNNRACQTTFGLLQTFHSNDYSTLLS